MMMIIIIIIIKNNNNAKELESICENAFERVNDKLYIQ
jgi:hypothetical protein